MGDQEFRTCVAIIKSHDFNWTGYGLSMEVWFAKKSYTAKIVQAIVCPTALANEH